mmetsp:Transcript_8117/g.28872  ORF Transcript_8117/g.28872 Transcript_8117/m.28872 type:complete len:102 (-) Transcript_8117:86-391(-)
MQTQWPVSRVRRACPDLHRPSVTDIVVIVVDAGSPARLSSSTDGDSRNSRAAEGARTMHLAGWRVLRDSMWDDRADADADVVATVGSSASRRRTPPVMGRC